MASFLWLDEPIHKNRFKGFSLDENISVLESLKISFDGSIMAVLESKVKDYYLEQEVSMVKSGYKKMPDKMKIDNEETFYRYLAYFVDI